MVSNRGRASLMLLPPQGDTAVRHRSTAYRGAHSCTTSHHPPPKKGMQSSTGRRAEHYCSTPRPVVVREVTSTPSPPSPILRGEASTLGRHLLHPKRALMKPPPRPKGSIVVSLIIPFILSKFVVHKATSHNQTLYSETLP